MKWTFQVHYRADGSKFPAESVMWLEADNQEAAIQEANQMVKQIPGGRLGYMMQGWITGDRPKDENVPPTIV